MIRIIFLGALRAQEALNTEFDLVVSTATIGRPKGLSRFESLDLHLLC